MISEFKYPLLKVLLDQGLTHSIQESVRNERTLHLPSPFPSIKAADEYEINGTIRVTPFAPLAPDPCKELRDALAAANAEIEESTET